MSPKLKKKKKIKEKGKNTVIYLESESDGGRKYDWLKNGDNV